MNTPDATFLSSEKELDQMELEMRDWLKKCPPQLITEMFRAFQLPPAAFRSLVEHSLLGFAERVAMLAMLGLWEAIHENAIEEKENKNEGNPRRRLGNSG